MGGRGTDPSATGLSVVVPVRDEASTLAELVERVRRAVDGPTDGVWELLLVDDGSTDESVAIARGLRVRDPRVRVLRLDGRAGQSAALDAGFRAARHAWIATLDADLQNPPEELPRLMAASDGVAMVHGRRRVRRDRALRRLASRVGNRARDLLTGHGLRDACCSLKLMRRDALERIPRFDGAHRFLPTLFEAHGLATREVDVDHAPRPAGRSKYGVLDRALTGFVDCLAVRWLRRRALRAGAAECDAGRTPVPRDAADRTPRSAAS